MKFLMVGLQNDTYFGNIFSFYIFGAGKRTSMLQYAQSYYQYVSGLFIYQKSEIQSRFGNYIGRLHPIAPIDYWQNSTKNEDYLKDDYAQKIETSSSINMTQKIKTTLKTKTTSKMKMIPKKMTSKKRELGLKY